MSKYGVFSGLYFPVFGLNIDIYAEFIPNTRKYVPEKTPYLDTFHSVSFRCSIYVKFPSMIPKGKIKESIIILNLFKFHFIKGKGTGMSKSLFSLWSETYLWPCQKSMIELIREYSTDNGFKGLPSGLRQFLATESLL